MTMERKGVRSSVVTADEVRGAMKRARTMTSEEEKVVRLRHGVGAETREAPLPKAAGGNTELGDELLVLEMQLFRAMLARHKQKQLRAVPAPAPAASRTKDKIVRALRKKR